MSKATKLKFGTRMHMNNFSKMENKISAKGRTESRDPYRIWHTLKHISKTSKATDFKFDFKFGIRVHVDNFSKIDK